ncbi:bacillithiol system redox-active protein YtxJ [Salisaeta longa]|uniref:bacillithiol system redox-active protein YtxJ n=1 Tax=Salisaeta longa TaxID=503170 RepID=UPI000688B961|nr:bacillithiol system redox-active protein YtxJ [Salisaeta longa]
MPCVPYCTMHELDDWTRAQAHAQEEPVVIFKHSNSCPVSAKAHRAMDQLSNDEDPPVYRVTVQTDRAISDAIADTLDLRHETPQVILLDGDAVVYHASHFDVTAEAVRNALAQHTGSTA